MCLPITFCVVSENCFQGKLSDFLDSWQTFLGRNMPFKWAIVKVYKLQKCHKAFFLLFTKVFLNPTNSIFFTSKFFQILLTDLQIVDICKSKFRLLSILTPDNITVPVNLIIWLFQSIRVHTFYYYSLKFAWTN